MNGTQFDITESFRPGDERARRERLQEIMDAYLRERVSSGREPLCR